MARPESRYVCQACGASTVRWEGQCRACGAWNTLVETLVQPVPRTSQRRRAAADAGVGGPTRRPLGSVAATATQRLPVGVGEIDRVLGGGLVPGSLILLAGEPGIGKSTLVLETAAAVAAGRGSDGARPEEAGSGAHGLRLKAARSGADGVRRDEAGRFPDGARSATPETAAARAFPSILYASGEESAAQLHLRAERLGLTSGAAADRIDVVATTEVDAIIAAALERMPDLLIVDSIQTLTTDGLEGPAGSVGQVRESAARLGAFAREEGVPVILVGHVTKDGSLAGPKALEHLVDVVMLLEGDRYGSLRLLRSAKNRFGSTEEVGVLEMTASGLREVPDPARAFLGEGVREAPGVAVAATLEGSRPLLIEVQALVTSASGYGMPRRTVAGLDANRLALLIAVLGRRAGINLANQDVYASLAGGASVEEPALDLPLALALASTFRDRPVRPGTVSCAEVSLLGELRPARGLERRLREAARLGFRHAIVARTADAPPLIPGLAIHAAGSVREAIVAALTDPDGTSGEG